jgi:hypothetical protein
MFTRGRPDQITYGAAVLTYIPAGTPMARAGH